MSDEGRKLIGSLKQKLADKVIDRREFLRYTTLLSMAAPTTYMWADKIAGENYVPVARQCPAWKFHIETGRRYGASLLGVVGSRVVGSPCQTI